MLSLASTAISTPILNPDHNAELIDAQSNSPIYYALWPNKKSLFSSAPIPDLKSLLHTPRSPSPPIPHLPRAYPPIRANAFSALSWRGHPGLADFGFVARPSWPRRFWLRGEAILASQILAVFATETGVARAGKLPAPRECVCPVPPMCPLYLLQTAPAESTGLVSDSGGKNPGTKTPAL
jgi:hypothetical protein